MMIRPSRRLTLLALLATPSLARAQAQPGALSPEDKALVDKAVTYLEGFTQVKGRFNQTDARGRTASGDFYLKRPGKIRLAYDPPSGLLVVSDGDIVSVEDKRLQTPPQQYPLGLSPLSLFLAKNIRLDGGVKVTKVDKMSDGFSITAKDSSHKTPGQIVLTFADKPMTLREWTIVDAQSGTTRVSLSNLAPANLDPALFVVHRATGRSGPHG
jgi:outer membrane lipoprotein-sorting protein